MGKFVLKALTGSVKGKVFTIKQGLKIGRSLGDILLDDSSVSNLHAEINIYPSGKIMIVDKDSKNKILINNQRFVKSILENGTKFKIGQTEFEVAFVDTPEEVLSKFMKKTSESIKDHPLVLKPFFQSIEMTFISGLQKGQTYYLSYGPRFFGAESVDFPIFEKEAPGKSFAIIPKELETFFVTKQPEIVRFNGKKIQRSRLKHGDRVLIGNTSLKFTFK